jgi:hypothetical protein
MFQDDAAIARQQRLQKLGTTGRARFSSEV